MIRHTSLTADTLGNVALTLPDGELLRFAGIDLAEEFLALFDHRIDESNGRLTAAVGDPADAGQRDPVLGDGLVSAAERNIGGKSLANSGGGTSLRAGSLVAGRLENQRAPR